MSNEDTPVPAESGQAWQEAVVTLRNQYQEKIGRWLHLLDQQIEKGASGEKVDRMTLEAIKIGLKFFDTSKDEKVSVMQKTRRATAKSKGGDEEGPHVSPADEARIRLVLENRV